MKEKSGAWVKTLVLILSINLFVCGDIVECTESVSKFLNSLSGDEIIYIINPCNNPEFKKGTPFGTLAQYEKEDEYYESFNECFKNIVIFRIDFEMDKNEKKIKKFFSSLRNRDKSYTFRNPCDLDLPEKITEILIEGIEQISEKKNKFAYLAIKNEDEKYIKETFYVITQSTYLKNIINDIESSIDEVFKDGEYISYNFCFLNTKPFQFDNNTFTKAYNIKRIDNLDITHNNESGNENEEDQKPYQFGNILNDPYNIENENSSIISNNERIGNNLDISNNGSDDKNKAQNKFQIGNNILNNVNIKSNNNSNIINNNERIDNHKAINNENNDKNEEAKKPFEYCYKLEAISCTREPFEYIYPSLLLTHKITPCKKNNSIEYFEIRCEYKNKKKEENNANNINNNNLTSENLPAGE